MIVFNKYNSNKIDVLIVIIIVALPFLFYIHKLTPNEPIWNTNLFTLETSKFLDIETFFWHLCVKIYIITLLIVWFNTCNHWWKFTILVPLIIEIYKLFDIFDNSKTYFDEGNYINSLPFTIPLIILLIILTRKFYYYKRSESLIIALNNEMDQVLDKFAAVKKENYRLIRNQLIELRRKKPHLNSEEYLMKLFELRDRILKS